MCGAHDGAVQPVLTSPHMNRLGSPSVNSFDAERWTTSLGFTEKEAWRPWTLDGGERMGGYVTRYENEFDFLTIRCQLPPSRPFLFPTI